MLISVTILNTLAMIEHPVPNVFKLTNFVVPKPMDLIERAGIELKTFLLLGLVPIVDEPQNLSSLQLHLASNGQLLGNLVDFVAKVRKYLIILCGMNDVKEGPGKLSVQYIELLPFYLILAGFIEILPFLALDLDLIYPLEGLISIANDLIADNADPPQELCWFG